MSAGETRIVITYRPADSQDVARLRECLSQELGSDRIAWHRGPASLNAKSRSADGHAERSILLVVIGPLWVQSRDDSGLRSLDNPGDRVRLLIEQALREKSPLFPVFVQGAGLPSAVDLPVGVRPLLLKRPVVLTPTRFDDDARDLVHRLHQELDWVQGPTGHLRTGDSPESTAVLNLDYAAGRHARTGDTAMWPVNVAPPRERVAPSEEAASAVPADALLSDTALAEPLVAVPPHDGLRFTEYPAESIAPFRTLADDTPNAAGSPRAMASRPVEAQLSIYNGTIQSELDRPAHANEEQHRERLGPARRQITLVRVCLAIILVLLMAAILILASMNR